MRCVALVVVIALPLGAAAQDAPGIDTALDQLLQLDPAALAQHMAALSAQAEQQTTEAAALRQQADALEQQAAASQTRVDTLTAQVNALMAALGLAVPAAPAPEAMAAGGEPMAAAAPPEAPAEAMQAAAPALTNFQDHVLPILKARCASCHNPDKRKSGFAVTTFAMVMEGGSSGPAVNAGDPDGSRLIKLISKAEEPFMPPSGDPLTAEQIATIRQWIADGAPADANAAPVAVAEDASAAPAQMFVAAQFADTPPMPEATLPAAQRLASRGVVARAVDASPRAPLMAVGGAGEVLLYSLDNYALLGALPFPEGDIFTLGFSVNGELLAVGGGEEGASGLCAIYEIRTGKRLGAYGELYDTVLAADISPDHRMVALGGPNNKVRVYATDSGSELYSLGAHSDWIYAVKFSPDGEVLASADRGGGLYLWQAATGRAVEQLRGHEGAINALDFTADSALLVSGGNDGTIQVWDSWKYARVRTFAAHAGPVLYLDVGANNQVVSCGSERVAKVWNLEGQAQRTLEGLADWGYAACFAKDASLIAVGTWDGKITLWGADPAPVTALDTNPPA